MVQYLAKRIGRSILTLFVIVTLVFCLLRLMPFYCCATATYSKRCFHQWGRRGQLHFVI